MSAQVAALGKSDDPPDDDSRQGTSTGTEGVPELRAKRLIRG
jgi:hypothetical protein